MIAIHKFPLLVTDRQTIQIPAYSRLLTVKLQDDVPTIWAMVDTTQEMIERDIVMFGTGQPIIKGLLLSFIGTVQIVNEGDSFIWHIFEDHPQPERQEGFTHGQIESS